MHLLLGATGVGKTLLMKRLHKLNLQEVATDIGDPPSTLPTVGTNLTDLTLTKTKVVTVRELGGIMGPIWPSYYGDCRAVMFMVDSANINQVSSSCIQLLSVISAEQLQNASLLLIFNKTDLPCPMTIVEMKSLFRLDEIMACASQTITVLELSARSGHGLQGVLHWLDSTLED